VYYINKLTNVELLKENTMLTLYLIRHPEDEDGIITSKGKEQLNDLAVMIKYNNITINYFCSSRHDRCRVSLKKLMTLLNYSNDDLTKKFLNHDFSSDQLKKWQNAFYSKKFQEKLLFLNSKYFAAKEICPELLECDLNKFNKLINNIKNTVPINSTIFCFSHNTFILSVLNNIIDVSEVPLTLNYCQGISLDLYNKSCGYLGLFN
jgi:hypothetical protein